MSARRGREAAPKRQEDNHAKLADTTRAELTRIATEFESAAAEHITRVEQILDQATAQGKAIDERMAGFDERQAEFTRRVQEWLEYLDAQVDVWRHELGRLHRDAERSIEQRIAGVDDHAQVAPAKADADAAAATTQAEAGVRPAAENQTHESEAADAAIRYEAPDALARREAGPAEAADARATDLGAMIAEASSAVEQAADRRVERLEAVYRDLRTALSDFQRHGVAAVQRSADDQVAALDHAATGWLGRIDRAGRKRRRGVWRRRAAPPATAVMLAIAIAFGGTLLVRGSNDRNTAAGASSPRVSPPAVAVDSLSPVSEPPPTDAAQAGQTDAPPVDSTAPPTEPGAQTNGASPSTAGPSSGSVAPSGAGGQSAPAAPSPPPADPSPPPASPAPSPPPAQPAPSPPSEPSEPSSPLDPLDPILAPVQELTGFG